VAHVAAGDEAALAELYDRHARAVYSFALAALGGRSAAEEVTEAAFRSLWREAPRFDAERGSARTWLLAAARRLVQERRPAVARSTVEEGDRLRRAVAALTPEQRATLRLVGLHGLLPAEIAVAAGAPEGAIADLLRRAVERLRQPPG